MRMNRWKKVKGFQFKAVCGYGLPGAIHESFNPPKCTEGWVTHRIRNYYRLRREGSTLEQLQKFMEYGPDLLLCTAHAEFHERVCGFIGLRSEQYGPYKVGEILICKEGYPEEEEKNERM